MNTTFTLSRYRKQSPAWMKTDTGKAYLELSLTFVTIIFFGWFALRPTFNTISELLGDLESLEEVNQKLDSKIDALAAAQIVYEEAEPRLELLSQSLPEKPEVSEFMARVEILAIESQVELITTKFDEFPLIYSNETHKATKKKTDQSESPWKEVGYLIQVAGDYEELENFTVALVQLRQMTLIDQLSLKIDSDRKNQTGALTLVLRGRLLFY